MSFYDEIVNDIKEDKQNKEYWDKMFDKKYEELVDKMSIIIKEALLNYPEAANNLEKKSYKYEMGKTIIGTTKKIKGWCIGKVITDDPEDYDRELIVSENGDFYIIRSYIETRKLSLEDMTKTICYLLAGPNRFVPRSVCFASETEYYKERYNLLESYTSYKEEITRFFKKSLCE